MAMNSAALAVDWPKKRIAWAFSAASVSRKNIASKSKIQSIFLALFLQALSLAGHLSFCHWVINDKGFDNFCRNFIDSSPELLFKKSYESCDLSLAPSFPKRVLIVYFGKNLIV